MVAAWMILLLLLLLLALVVVVMVVVFHLCPAHFLLGCVVLVEDDADFLHQFLYIANTKRLQNAIQ